MIFNISKLSKEECREERKKYSNQRKELQEREEEKEKNLETQRREEERKEEILQIERDKKQSEQAKKELDEMNKELEEIVVLIDEDSDQIQEIHNPNSVIFVEFWSFDLDEIKSLTKNLYIQKLFEINNKRLENYWIISKFNRRHQQEFVGYLMRFGLKGNDYRILYNLIKERYRRRYGNNVISHSQEDFVHYGEKFSEFWKFLLMFKNLRNKPHFLLNFNSAEKIRWCIDSIARIDYLFRKASNHPGNYLYDKNENYLRYLEEIQKTHNWNYRDDYLLLKWVLKYGFNKYLNIANSVIWIKTNPRIIKFVQENNIDIDNTQLIMQHFDYKMLWENLYERVFRFDIVSERKINIRCNRKKLMWELKTQIEEFLRNRVNFILKFDPVVN